MDGGPRYIFQSAELARVVQMLMFRVGPPRQQDQLSGSEVAHRPSPFAQLMYV